MTILITGASAGFGESACRLFVEKGYKVIGAARRLDKLQAMQQELGDLLIPLQMDMRDQHSIDHGLSQIDLSQVELLVNNAGLALGQEPAQQTQWSDWQQMIETNIIGLSYLTHQILPSMVKNQRGHVINIGSIAGNYAYPGGNVYGASKAFVKQFSRNLRCDLAGTHIRVSNIEPGLCGATEFSQVRYKGDCERAAKLYDNVDFIRPEDIAETIWWIFNQPQHVNVNSVEIMPVAQSWSALNVCRDAQ